MNRQIVDGVHWVGYVDWSIRDFHGYVTERGSTYNSYVILDEEPARGGFGQGALCGESARQHFRAGQARGRPLGGVQPRRAGPLRLASGLDGGLPQRDAGVRSKVQGRPGDLLRHVELEVQDREDGRFPVAGEAHAGVHRDADGPLAGEHGDLDPAGQAPVLDGCVRTALCNERPLRRRGAG